MHIYVTFLFKSMADGLIGEPGAAVVWPAVVDLKHACVHVLVLPRPTEVLIVKGIVPSLDLATQMTAQVKCLINVAINHSNSQSKASSKLLLFKLLIKWMQSKSSCFHKILYHRKVRVVFMCLVQCYKYSARDQTARNDCLPANAIINL